MKDRFLSLTKTVIAPVALAIAMVAFSPVAALAAGHGGAEAMRADLVEDTDPAADIPFRTGPWEFQWRARLLRACARLQRRRSRRILRRPRLLRRARMVWAGIWIRGWRVPVLWLRGSSV